MGGDDKGSGFTSQWLTGMTGVMPQNVPEEEALDTARIRELQIRKLAAMLYVVRASNPFYKLKLAGHAFDPATGSLDDLPFTTRAELE